jgi:hypothetical protein
MESARRGKDRNRVGHAISTTEGGAMSNITALVERNKTFANSGA